MRHPKFKLGDIHPYDHQTYRHHLVHETTRHKLSRHDKHAATHYLIYKQAIYIHTVALTLVQC